MQNRVKEILQHHHNEYSTHIFLKEVGVKGLSFFCLQQKNNKVKRDSGFFLVAASAVFRVQKTAPVALNLDPRKTAVVSSTTAVFR